MSTEQKQPLNRFPRMMQEYLVRRVRTLYNDNHERVMELRTREEALRYIEKMQGNIAKVFEPRPERTPLNLRLTGEHDRGAYRIQNIIFDSRPGFPVTAALYLPQGFPGPRPAVLCPCGHSWNAKAGDVYQRLAQGLARMGYITLMFDPMGQGERYQYPDGSGGSVWAPNSMYPSVYEHNAMDRQMALAGDWIGRWFVRDGIRAMDVLLEQENADKTRVGVTGVSGGGTMTAYAAACDPRVTMAAPCCWVSSWHHNIINEEPLDGEQCPPGILAQGMEQSDLLISRAPNPLILITEEQDFFDQRGSLEAYKRLQHIYRLLDAEENLAYYAGPNVHGYWDEARKAMHSFFNRHAGIDAPSPEPDLVIEDEEVLQATPDGQVSCLEGTRPVPDFTRERSMQLAAERGVPSGGELVMRVRALLHLPERKRAPVYRILRPWTDRNYVRPHANQFVLETDPEFGAQAVVTKLEHERRVSRPLRGTGPALLYLPHISSDQELREDEDVRDLQTEDIPFFACDFRGIGESQPDTCRANSFFHHYGSDYQYAVCAQMLGESYAAWRVHDVLCTLDWMADLGYDQVHLAAKGWGTIPGALAALIDSRVNRVTLINALSSYAELAETPLQKWPLSAMLPGVLAYFDLPDVYRELASKDLRLIRPWDSTMGL